MSQERISPRFSICMAMAKDLPPGAAHTSSTRSPGFGPAAMAAKRAAASCTVQRPDAKADRRSKSPVPVTSKQPSSQGCGTRRTPSDRSAFSSSAGVVFSGLACITVGTGSLSNRRNASASCSPTKAVKRSTNHLGWLYCTAALETKPFCGNGGKVFLLDAHFRSTALIMPAARALPRRFVSSTVS